MVKGRAVPKAYPRGRRVRIPYSALVVVVMSVVAVVAVMAVVISIYMTIYNWNVRHSINLI